MGFLGVFRFPYPYLSNKAPQLCLTHLMLTLHNICNSRSRYSKPFYLSLSQSLSFSLTLQNLLANKQLKSKAVPQQAKKAFEGTRVQHHSFLGAFAKLRKATNRFVMFVHPSVRMEQTGSHCPDFDGSRYLNFLKSVEEIKVSLKPDKNNGSLSWRPKHIFDNSSLYSSYNGKYFR